MNKRLLLISIILIALCSLSAVSANEIDDADTTDGILSVPLEDNVVSADSSINFTKFSENIADNDVVDLSSDVILAEGENSKYSGGIPINKNVTINGNNHIVNGTDLVRIFNIGNNANVVLKDLVITGARTTSGHGGAIYMATGTLTVENCTFVNNTLRNNGAHGGAIHAAARTSLTIKDSVFDHNINTPINSANYWSPTSNYGGAIYCGDYATLTVTNTLFKENAATRGSYSNRNMYDGAISSFGANSLNTITDCTFINNTATNGIGAIEIRVGNITGCVFDDNYGTNDYPTIYISSNGKATISYNVFLDDTTQIRARNSVANIVEEYNWWATNEPGKLVRMENTYVDPNKFLMLDVYNEGNIVKAGFMKDSNRDDIPDINALPLRTITLTGDVNETAPKLVNGIATVEYTSEITGENTVSATIDGYTVNYNIALGNITNIDAIYVENTTVGDDGKIIIYAYGDNGPVNGNATIFLNDTKFDVTIENGMAILNAGSTLDAGIYDIYSYYLGDANYVPSSNKVKSINKFEIKKADVNITYTIDQNSGYITIKISDKVTPTGSTTADVFGNSRTFSGTSIMYDSGAKTLSNGTYLVNITYNGDKNHNVCSLVEEVDLIKNNLTIDISREGTVFTFNLTNEYGIPTGSVIAMFEGSNSFSRTINLNNGVATYDFGSQLHNGTYNLTVTFNGDMNFDKATANGTYDINKLTATVVADPIIVKVIRTNSNFVVTVVGAEGGPTPTGTVSYITDEDWGESESATLNTEGTASLRWQAWTDPYGQLMNQSKTISYSGDSNYDSASIVVLFQTTPNLSISSTIDGNNITFSFTCAEWEGGARGTIYIKHNGEDLGNVSAIDSVTFQSFKDENLSMGLHNYEFIWDYGNGNNYTFTKSVELREAGESQWAVPGFDNKNSGNPDYTRLDNGFILWNATVNNPLSSVVIDSQGNIYIADNSNVNIFFNNGTLKATSQGGSQGAISLIDDQYIIYVRPWSNIAGFDVGTFRGISAYDTQVQWYTNTWYAPIKGEDGRIYLSVYFNNGGMPNGGMYLTMLGIENNEFTYLNVMINKQPISSPVIDDNGILWLNTVGGLYGVDTSSDSVIFSNPNLGIVGRPVIDDANIAYVFGKDNTINAVNAEGIVWNVTVNNGIGSVMAIDNENGLLYAVDQNGTLFSYDVNDNGAEVEVYNIGANATSIIVDGDSKVYVSDDLGNVWAFDSEGNLLWNVVLNAPVKAQLAMDKDGVIYAVTQNTLYAIGYRNELAIEVTVPEGEYTALDNVTITATLNETTEGNITFTIGDKNITVAINGTVAELTTTLPGGNQTIVATFEGNDAFMPAAGNATVDIAKVDVEFENVPEEISMEDYAFFNFNIVQNNTIVSVGTNTFKVYKDDEELSNSNYGIYDGFELELWEISSGNYNMTIAFVGNDVYNPANATFYLSVLPKVSANVVVSDDEMTVDVQVGDSVYPYNPISDATGKFTVIANNETLGEGTIENGVGSVTFDKLEPGTYEFTIVYDGDDNYPGNNATLSIKIPRTSQWPSVGGNPQNSGAADATREDGVSIIWEAALNGDLRSSAIIDSFGNVYVNDGSKIYAFTNEGKLIWSGGIGSAGIALYKDELILAPQYHNAMMIYNATTGAAIPGNFWSASSNFAPITGPDGRIYTPTDYGYPANGQGWSGNYWVSVFDETGNEWEPYGFNLFLVEVTGVGYGSQAMKASPSFDKLGYIYANTVKGFKIVNVATGATVFSDTSINGVGRPVIDANNIAYILDSTLNGIYAISTEGIIWNVTVTDGIGSTLAVDNENGFLYAVNANGTLYKYDTTDGSESLVYDLGANGVSIILDADGNVYVSTAAGDVVALSAEGDLLWTINLGSKVTGQLAMGNNGIIYAVADKKLYALGFDANMIVSGENVSVFDDEIITVSIAGEGNVTITFNGESTEVPIENGVATLNVGKLIGGVYSVSASYAGDGVTYGPAFAESTFEIIKADAELNVEVNDGVITVSINENATGDVVVTVGDISFVKNAQNLAPIDASNYLGKGTYPVTVSYAGDDIFAGETVTGTVTVKAATIIVAPDVSVAYKDPNGEVVATIVNQQSKPLVVNVNVIFNGEEYALRTDSNGRISIPIGNLTPGKYAAEILFKGSKSYKASNATAWVTVTKSGTVISAPDVSLAYKDPTGELVGTITNENGKALVVNLNVNFNGKDYTVRTDSDGRFSLSVGTLTPGKYSATISYKGSKNYGASSVTALVTVTKSGTVISAPDVSLAYKDSTGELVGTITNEHGKALVVNLNVNLNGKDYTVRTDSDGRFTLPIGTLASGNHVATISYKGSKNYEASSATVQVNVNKAASVISAQDVSIAYKDPNAELSALVISEHGKTLEVDVTVNLNGKNYTVRTDSNGRLSIPLDTLSPGDYTATIIFKGSRNYQGFTTTAQVSVRQSATTISAPDVSVAYKDPNAALVATITNEHGKVLGVSLNVNLNGKDYTLWTGSDGTISLPVDTLTPGNYTATISYKGSKNYEASSTTAQVVVAKSNTMISAPEVTVSAGDSSGALVATVTNQHDKPLVVSVKVNLNGKTTTVKTDSNGQISVPTKDLKAGTYDATISYKGSGNYNGSTVTTQVTVI